MKRWKLLLGALLIIAAVASFSSGVLAADYFDLIRVADIYTPVPGGTRHFKSFWDFDIDGENVGFTAGIREDWPTGVFFHDGTKLTKVADRKTWIPEWEESFSDFWWPAVSGRKIAFQGGGDWDRYGGDYGYALGLYLYDGARIVRIVDPATPVPDRTDRRLGISWLMRPWIDGENVAFTAYSYYSHTGIYLFDESGLRTVADDMVPIPEGEGFFEYCRHPALKDGKIAFYGEARNRDGGIYLFDGSSLSMVADERTLGPDGASRFRSFSAPEIGGDGVVFQGTLRNGRRGIYSQNGSGLATIADARTPIPGGEGRFKKFSEPTVDGNMTAFQASDRNGVWGIYLHDGKTLHKIVDTLTPVPGDGGGSFVELSDLEVSGGNVLFRNSVEDKITGIYLHDGFGLVKVADTNTKVPERGEAFESFGYSHIRKGNICFTGSWGGRRNAGIYRVELHQKEACVNLAPFSVVDFSFSGKKGEKVRLSITPRTRCAGETVKLAISGSSRVWKGSTDLPLKREFTLPETGAYRVAMSNGLSPHGRSPFRGVCCVRFDSTGDAWKTFKTVHR